MLKLALALAFMLPTLPALAQDADSGPVARVTFYSVGKTFLKLPGSRAAYTGKLYDDNRQLALLERNRFVTFNLVPGTHVLTANWWLSEKPSGGAHVILSLVAGHHYFISTGFEQGRSLSTKILMKEASCDEARQANRATKPLAQRYLRPPGFPDAVAESTFPACQ